MCAGADVSNGEKGGAKLAGAEPASVPMQAAAAASEPVGRSTAVQCGDAQALHLPAMER